MNKVSNCTGVRIKSLRHSAGNRKGYTIFEQLVCLLLISLTGLVIAGGFVFSINGYKQISVKTACNHLAYLYEEALRTSIENAESIYYSNESGKLIINSSSFGVSGFFDDENGIIRFHKEVNESESTCESELYIDFCPAREHVLSVNNIIYAELNCELKEEGYVDITLKVFSDNRKYMTEKKFYVWPMNTILEIDK